MGAHLAGVRSAMLMQEPRVSCGSERHRVGRAALYRIPLLTPISARGSFGERDPWQTEGGLVTEHVLDSLRIPRIYLETQADVARTIAHAQTLAYSASRPVAILLGRGLDVGGLTAMLRREAMAAVFPDLERRAPSSSPSRARWRLSFRRSGIARTSFISSTRWVSRAHWPGHRAVATRTARNCVRRRRLAADESAD